MTFNLHPIETVRCTLRLITHFLHLSKQRFIHRVFLWGERTGNMSDLLNKWLQHFVSDSLDLLWIKIQMFITKPTKQNQPWIYRLFLIIDTQDQISHETAGQIFVALFTHRICAHNQQRKGGDHIRHSFSGSGNLFLIDREMSWGFVSGPTNSYLKGSVSGK